MVGHKPNNTGGDKSGRDAARRGRPSHGQEKPSGEVLDRQQSNAGREALVAKRMGQFLPINDSDSTMTGVEDDSSQTGPVRGGSFSSRGGFTGRGRGGSNTGRGRVYHNNNQRGRRPVASSSRHSEEKSLAVATSSMMTRVADNLGRKAAQLVNHTPEGGNSHAFVQKRPANEVWGVTPGYGVEEEIRDLKKRSGCSHVIFQLIPMDEERFKTVSKYAIEKTMEDHDGKNVDGKSALLFRGKVDPEPKQEGEDEAEKCKLCGNPAHTVATCFSRTGKGESFGCPLCDKADHTGSTCERVAALPLTEQVKLLITNRGDMPAYRAESVHSTWWHLMHRFCMSEEFDPTLVSVVPWSKTHIKKLRNDGIDILDLQKQYDLQTGFQLPRDPLTDSFAKIAEKYWDTQFLPWPPKLGERPEPTRRRRDGDQKMAEAAPEAAAAPAEVSTAAVPAAPPAAAPAAAPAPAPTFIFAGPDRDEMYGGDSDDGKSKDSDEDLIGYSDDDNTK